MMRTMNHPGDNDLALLAGGEAGRVQRFLLDRHVRACPECREKIAEYRELRAGLAALELPDLNWNFLAADMRANIRLGLEAGACVRGTQVLRGWHPRITVAFASLVLLAGAGFFLRDPLFLHDRPLRSQPNAAVSDAAAPSLQLTGSGVEFRTGKNSLTLLNHHGNATNQTVSARGDIGARYIDGETGSVTINNVYLQ
jgi:hypothetical protein